MAAASLARTATVVALTLVLSITSSAACVPPVAMLGLAAGVVSELFASWPLYRDVVGCTRRQALRAIVCRMALFRTRLTAGMAGWRSASGTFRRTSKFPASSTRMNALASTARETAQGATALGVAAWAIVVRPGSALVQMLACYMVAKAASCLAAPVLARSADRSLRAAGRD